MNWDTIGDSWVKAIEEEHPKPGNFAIFTGIPGNPNASRWMPVVQKGLQTAGWKLVYEGNTNWTPAGELQSGSAAIAKGQTIDAIAYDGAGPGGLITAFQRAHAKLPIIVSTAPGNTYYVLWKKPGSPANQFTTNSQTWTSRVALWAALQRADGHQIPGIINLPEPLIKTADSESSWGPTLKYGPACLPPTFLPPAVITQFTAK